MMIKFVLGCMLGGVISITTMCCCIAGKEADKHIDYTDSDE